MQIEQSLLQGFLALYEPLLNSFLDNQCFINQRVYDINSIENMGLDNFKKITEIRKPFKLFKYFNNVYNGECNYSQEALVNNTVFLNKSSSFDDIFDSSININKNSYIELRKEKYFNVLGVQSISDIISVLKNVTLKEDMWLTSFFTHSIENALLKTRIEVFLQRLFCNVILNQRINEYEQFFYAALENEYDDYIEQLKNTFGVSCFTTNQFSQLMWSFYANNHKGFCLEYVIDDSFNLEPDYKLLPLIYCRNRPDATSRFVPIMDDTTDNTKLWQLYFHGVLRKGMEWALSR